MHSTPRLLVSVLLATALLGASCSSGESAADAPETTSAPTTAASASTPSEPAEESTTTVAETSTTTEEPAGPRIVEHAFGSTEVPADPQRIVALGEEFLLADLLSLGVKPIASSSNNADAFPGIDPELAEGIEVIATASLNLEYVASLEPDLIVSYPGLVQFVDFEVVNGIAPFVPIGDDDSDWRERLVLTAEAVGRDAEFADRIALIEAAFDEASATLDGQTLSVVAIFSGPFIRMYTSGDHRLMGVAVEAGAELVPTDVSGADVTGRVVITEEQLGLLQGDVMLLLQSDLGAADEDQAVAGIAETTLWQALPAVQADRVITLDRLGYPGAEGLAEFATDLSEAVAALG